MARHIEVIDIALPIEQAFELVADFARTSEWDPGVVSAKATTRAPLRAGSRFRVEVSLLGRTATYGYAITDFEPPSRVVLHGGDGRMLLVDEITLVSRGRGTRITWELRCDLAGLGRIADPLIDLVLPRIASRAAEGLRRYTRTLALRDRASQRPRKAKARPKATVQSKRTAASRGGQSAAAAKSQPKSDRKRNGEPVAREALS